VLANGLRVRDVATVQVGTEDHVRIIAGDGKPAALINITRQLGGNTLPWPTAWTVSWRRSPRRCRLAYT